MALNSGKKITGKELSDFIEATFMTTAALAELKSVSRKTVEKWMAKGIAPAYETFAGHNWFHRSAAESFVKPKAGRRKK